MRRKQKSVKPGPCENTVKLSEKKRKHPYMEAKETNTEWERKGMRKRHGKLKKKERKEGTKENKEVKMLGVS